MNLGRSDDGVGLVWDSLCVLPDLINLGFYFAKSEIGYWIFRSDVLSFHNTTDPWHADRPLAWLVCPTLEALNVEAVRQLVYYK
jgi:hypothetical protein